MISSYKFLHTFNTRLHFVCEQRDSRCYVIKVLLQSQKRIDFHVKRNVLKPEPYKDAYHQLAQHLIINFHFWIPQQLIKGKPATLNLFKHSLWSLLYPHFTAKGIKEYDKLITAR